MTNKGYWVCSKCGLDVSQKPRNRLARTLREDRSGFDHWPKCMQVDPLEVSTRAQGRLRLVARERGEAL